jgi:glycosyltransferase involved in cell wall biosynthesis
LRIAVLVKTNEGGDWIPSQAQELRRRGHHVTVIMPPGPGRLRHDLQRLGIDTADSPFGFGFRPRPATLRQLWRLRRLIRDLRPDVLNYHLHAATLAGRLASVGLRLRRVHMVAGPLHLESTLVRAAERLLWRMDHLIVCCTEHISRLYGALGCPAARRPVAQYGIDLEYFTPPPDAGPGPSRRAKARAEIGVPEDVFLAVMVSWVYEPKRLAYHGRGIKGQDVLLEAWPAFHARHPRSHLLLIGEGNTPVAEAYRQSLIRRFGVADDPGVTWLGWVPDLRPYYTAADVSVTPSLVEGSNRVVREASAMQVPSIVSDAGGLPEAVDDTCGWVVPRGEPSALAGALGAAHREFVTTGLTARAERARDRARRVFDHRESARRVADLVERAADAGRGATR